MSYQRCTSLRAAWAALLVLFTFPLAAVAQPSPQVDIQNLRAESFIGEPVTFTVAFDNASLSATGYGPYIDLRLPATGADGNDGLTFVGATYLGANVTYTIVPFDGAGNATHPYAVNNLNQPIVVTGTPGHQLVVLQLPFGSFTPDQPVANIQVTANLSSLADADTPLTITARAGFQFGADALHNPAVDPSIFPPTFAESASTVPTVLRLRKTYLGPEDETATGPNFPRQYLIEVDIANGQTVTALDLTDALPNNIQFLQVDATTIRGTTESTAAVATPSTTTPGGTITRRFTSVTGTTAENDATLLFSFYVPRVDSVSAVVLDPNTGDDSISIDDASTSGSWDPTDTRDPLTTVTSNVRFDDHVLTDKSIAIQKSYAIAVDNGAAGPSPGDVVDFTLDIQVSDFFAFQTLVVNDVLGDGLRHDGVTTPTLLVNGNQFTSPTAGFNVANFAFTLDGSPNGTQTGVFQVSNELILRGHPGQLIGGCVPDTGTGGPVPDCTGYNDGATTLRIVYRTVIQDEYEHLFPSGDASVDEGDVLVNNVTVTGDVLNVADLTTTGNNEADTSAESLTIAQGQLFKEIYAINGSTTLPVPLRITPGDTITYRLRLTLPTADVEPLTINDYLPLPIFDATTVTGFQDVIDGNAPPAGFAKFGPADTFRAASGQVPTLSQDSTSNSLTFEYDEYDSPANVSRVIDLLFTVTVENDPFANGLYLTNQANAQQSTTQMAATTRDAIVQVQLGEPVLRILKSVVQTNAASAGYGPANTSWPITFASMAGSGFTGTLNSTNLASNPIDSNLIGPDTGDRVRFAIIVENRGDSDAYDVAVSDQIPTGFITPPNAAGLSLQVRRGDGTLLTVGVDYAVSFNTGTGAIGVVMVDTSGGAVAAYDPSSGANILVITYELDIAGTPTYPSTFTNTASITQFAGTEGGPNHVVSPLTDTASVSIAAPMVTKVMTTTNHTHTAGSQVAIGEQITYTMTIRVPEGTSSNVRLVDDLPSGLAVVTAGAVTFSSGAITSSAGTDAQIAAAVLIDDMPSGAVNEGRRATWNFGTLTNSDNDNGTDETITVVLTAVVLNSPNNVIGQPRMNTAVFEYGGTSRSASSTPVTIAEPRMLIDKIALPTTADAGDTVVFTITVISPPAANRFPAQDVHLSDTLPAGLSLVSVVASGPNQVTPVIAGNGFTADWTAFPFYGSATFTVTATVDAGASSGGTITNTAGVTWTSLPGDVTVAQTTNNTLSVERTGDTGDVGGSENDYRASYPAAVTVAAAVPVKTITATSLTDTVGNNVAIGEIVTYQVRIAIPEGVSNTVSLVDTLPVGMAFVDVDSPTASAGVTISGSYTPVITGGGRTVTFNLGNVTNVDSDNGVTEYITITYRAVVTNIAGNQSGTTLTNNVVWNINGTPASNDSGPTVTVVEPNLVTAKTALPTAVDAGGTITYTIQITNNGTAAAYDAQIVDVIPAGMTFVPGSLSHTAGVAPSTPQFAGGTITVTYDVSGLLPTESSTIQFQATVDTTPAPATGSTISNTANVTWTSYPGAPGQISSYETNSTERTGAGGVNDYTGSDGADITIHESSISGTVYVDANDDGVLDVGELRIAGVTVTLTGTDHLGATVNVSVTTDVNGAYMFPDLRPGTYTITESHPAGYLDGRESVGTPALGATAGNDVFTTITLPASANTTATNFNFGELAAADLRITKIGTPPTVAPNGDIVYTIEVTNAGPNAATNAVFTDALPGGTTFLSSSSAGVGGWSCSTPAVGMPGNVSCTLASFAPAATTTFTITVRAEATALPHSTLRNVATITSETADPTPSNNQDDETTVVAATGDADVAIVKTAGQTSANPGDPVTFTLTVTNYGPGASDVTVAELLPSQFDAGTLVLTPSVGSCDPMAATCNLGTMAPGATATIAVQVQVSAAATLGVVTNTATVDGSAPDPNPANDSSSVPLNIGGPDISITKTGPVTVARGGIATYTLLVRHEGGPTATDVTVTDPAADPGLTFLSNTGDCTTAFPCVLGSINAGETRTIVARFQVDAAYAGTNPFVNVASVTTTATDANPANNTSQVETLVADATEADLSIVKLDSPDAQVAGRDVAYSLVVTNNGPATATGVIVTDVLPAGVTFVGATPSQGTCGEAGGTVTCNVGTLINGANATIAVRITSNSALPTPNPMVNTASVAASTIDPRPTNDQDDEPTTIVAATDLSIDKTAPVSVTAGSPITFTIVVTNNGPSDAENVSVADPTPAGLVFTSNTGDCTTTFPCALGTVAAGQTRTITATFAVPSSYTTPAMITNTATVSTTTGDTDATNNADTTNTTLVIATDLGVTKTGPATTSAGGTIAYTITVTNNGPSDAASVTVADPTPVGLTFLGNTGACTLAYPCVLTNVVAGESRTITSSYRVPPGYLGPDPIVNTVTVSNPDDTDNTNDSATFQTVLGPPSADLVVTKVGPVNAIPGQNLVYTITVTNNGPADAANVTLDDPTPTNLSWVSNAGDCTGAFPCLLGTMAPGDTRSITATFLVPAGYTTPSTITNTATATTITNDTNPGNNSAQALTSAGTDLVLTKTVDDTTPNVTETVLFTITLRNAGPSPATGVAVVDQIPAGLTVLNVTPSAGTYDQTSGRWAVGPLAVNDTVTLAVQARVDASGGVTNTATITEMDQADIDTSNNTAGAAINVPAASDIQVQKAANVAEASVGATVTYTITVRNAGPDAATSVEITDALPPSLSLLTVTPSAGAYDVSTSVWTIGPLAVDATVTLTMTARILEAGAIQNTATVTRMDQFDTAPANNASGVSVNGLSSDLQVVKTVDRNAPHVGDPVTFTIVVTNNGPGEATNVRVRDLLPASLAFVSATATQGVFVPETGMWSVGMLTAPGAGGSTGTATLTINTILVSAGGGSNMASVAGGDQPDPNPANDATGVAFTGGTIDLQAGLTFIGDGNAVGKLFDFFVDVTNRGNQPASQPLLVAIPFPSELSFAAPQTSWPCEAVGRTLFCSHDLTAPLDLNQSKSLAYWADVVKTFPRGLAAYAHVVSAQDANVANNVGSVLLTPPAAVTADLRVTQTLASPPSAIGQTASFRIDVTNLGPGAAHDVTLIDVLDEGLTLVSISPETGTCAGTRKLACSLGTLTSGQTAVVTVNVQPTTVGLFAHTASASGREPDGDLTNNAARLTFSLGAITSPLRDTDQDGLPDLWESQMGLDPATADADADPDNDGLSNAEEYAQRSHPRGFFKQFFAEGVANQFFGTMFSLVNPSSTRAASVAIELMRDTGEVTMVPLPLGARERRDVGARELLDPQLGSFSTLIESDQPVASDRLTWWDSTGYGTALEASVSSPSLRWLFAEGATHGFRLFFLLQNPDPSQAADVTIRYLLPTGVPVVKTYVVAPHSRLTIPVNDIVELQGTDVSAEILSNRPIVAERAMYRDAGGQLMAAGHAGSGSTAPHTSWLFAEGATGDFFNLYLLLANPNAAASPVSVRYLLPDGQTIDKTYTVAGNARVTIDVATQDARLASNTVGMIVTSTLPIVAERAMWWPGPRYARDWYESHVVVGATESGTRWAWASGAQGGPLHEQTFILVANQAATSGRLRVTVVLDNAASLVQELTIAPNQRLTLEIGDPLFPAAVNHAFSVIVESIGATPVPIVVEGARYASPDGQLWGAGAAALATRLP